ncbi:hypothetical protein ACWGI8_31905 [Streptomyces sp. NPDC054841]
MGSRGYCGTIHSRVTLLTGTLHPVLDTVRDGATQHGRDHHRAAPEQGIHPVMVLAVGRDAFPQVQQRPCFHRTPVSSQISRSTIRLGG